MNDSKKGTGLKAIGDLLGRVIPPELLRAADAATAANNQVESAAPDPATRVARRQTAAGRFDNFMDDAMVIQSSSTQEREALRFIARVLVQATFPHSEVDGNEWSRTNGDLSVDMLAPSKIGLPYGSYPRLLMTWITTEAVSNKQRKSGDEMRRLELGHSLSGFMTELGLTPTGGRWGTIPRLRDQMTRLFSTSIHMSSRAQDAGSDQHGLRLTNRQVANEAELWWDARHPEQGVLWGSWVELSQPFFDLITERPVPVDMDVLRLVKKSPMALDIYCWATYRVSYLSSTTVVPWRGLMMQLGAGYPDTPQGHRDFKKKFIAALTKVHAAWPELRVQVTHTGLMLRPCTPHVRRKLTGPPPKHLR